MLSDRRATDNQIPEQPYRDSEVSLELEMALLRLSPTLRAAVVLFYFADLPATESLDGWAPAERRKASIYIRRGSG
jgi:DNA-directed RNA polymerase specialized sigma24 family protein